MRPQPRMEVAKRTSLLRSPFVRKVGIASIVTVIWLAPLVSVSAWIGHNAIKKQTTASTGGDAQSNANPATLWQHDTHKMAANFPLAQQSQGQQFTVDPAFVAYYNSHNGNDTLGTPLTTAYPIAGGTIQFFTSGALLLPPGPPQSEGQPKQATQATQAVQASDNPLRNGLTDTASGVLRLPLVEALLTVGSEARIGGTDGTLTYVDLRNATLPHALVSVPPGSSSSQPSVTTTGDMFVPTAKQGSAVVGHRIPQAIWQYINSSAMSPDSWQTDFGAPLTEALPLTATRNGAPHHLLVQLFTRGGVVVDQDTPDTTGGPTAARLEAGAAYLQTLGPPKATPAAGAQIWATGDMALASDPASSTEVAHIGQNFPLELLGDTAWLNGELWYHVKWQELQQSGSGWVRAAETTFASPSGAPAWASFDILSPDLAKYLSGLGRNTGAVVYDESRGQYYTYNPNGQFIMASSAKVPIMLTFLTMTEHQGREPNDQEMYLLTTMIENSDNDSAQALFDEIGGAGPMADFARSVHVSGLNPDPDAWGWSTVSPLAMVQFLTLLHDGKVLNAHDRALALNLMENIEPDQRTGVGDTAPQGATVAMKDGWVPAPNGLWAMNSSGIVTVGGETYIIAVYTQDDNQLSDGWTITQNVAGQVGKLLAR